MKTKVCTKCKKRRSAEKFNQLSSTNGEKRLHSWCKDCANARRQTTRFYEYAAKYGLSTEGMEELNKIFPVCAICGAKKDSIALCVDHCHTDGTIRGRLCVNCNSGIGQFRDDIKLLHKAVEYLVGDNPRRKRWARRLLKNPQLQAENTRK